MKKVQITVKAEYDEKEKYIIPSHIARIFLDNGFDHIHVKVEEVNEKISISNKEKLEPQLVWNGLMFVDKIIN